MLDNIILRAQNLCHSTDSEVRKISFHPKWPECNKLYFCVLWPKFDQNLLNNNSDSVCVYLQSTLNEAVNISGHIASTGWRTDELESV